MTDEYSPEQAYADLLARKVAFEQITDATVTDEQALTIASTAIDALVRRLAAEHRPLLGEYSPEYGWAVKAQEAIDAMLQAEKDRLAIKAEQEDEDASPA